MEATTTETTHHSGASRVPWIAPAFTSLEALRAAEAYLGARSLDEQIAVLTLIREVES